MADFKVVEVFDKTRDWEGKGDSKFTSFYVRCEGDERTFEVVKKRGNDGPRVGEVIDADAEKREHDGKVYWKLKAVQRGGFGGGGPRQTHPADAARMGRAHAQDMAIETLKLAASLGVAPALSDVKGIVGAVKTLADAYDKDVRENGVPS